MSEGLSGEFVRITLVQPYYDTDDSRPIQLRWGSEPARKSSGGYLGADTVIMSENMSLADSGFQKPAQYIPGRRKTYDLCWGDQDLRAAIVPAEVARHYFGDWTITEGRTPVANSERNYNEEKIRVANVWGGYIREKKRLQRGDIGWMSARIIGAPRIPHVFIERLDSAQRRIPGEPFTPWDHWKWMTEVTSDEESIQVPKMAVTLEQFAALASELKSLKEQLDAKSKKAVA
jgi:hypothetical protein